MTVDERKQAILDSLKIKNKVLVSDISQAFGISEVTIRKYLSEMEDSGLLKRIHGGAIRSINSSYEPQMAFLEKCSIIEKKRIAEKAYTFIDNDDAIMLDASSTVREMCQLIKTGSKKNLTIVTPSIKTAWELMGCEHIEIIQIGGNLRHNNYSVMGPIAIQTIRAIHVDKAFIGVNGIDIDSGLTTPNLFECEVKQAMLASSRLNFVLSDSSKINRAMLGIICPLNEIDYIITDDAMPQHFQEKIIEAGTQLLIV